MTPIGKVYGAFLSKMLEDEWANWTEEEIKADLMTLLQGAIAWFKFPRVNLDIVYDDEEDEFLFKDNLTNAEIQILASFMKCEWLNRTIMTWENVKPLYEERDFSQANLLDKFNQMLEAEKKNAEKLERIYYRSINNKPFNYGRLANNG